MSYTPTDPGFSNQGYYVTVQAPEAWSIDYPTVPTVAAVIDTGFNLAAADLSTIIQARNFVGATGGSDGQAGAPYTDGHGTLIASILGAAHDGVGMVGGFRDAQMLGIKGFDSIEDMYLSSGTSEWNDVIEAINWAVANGAKVINLSFGSPGVSETIRNNVTTAVNNAISADCVVVIAAGNDGVDIDSNPLAPIGAANAIVVGGLHSDFTTRYADSNFSAGGNVHICAPAVSIYGLFGASYTTANGTSCAAAIVSGAVAQMRSINPRLTAAEVRSIILDSANTDAVTATNVGRRVNYFKAVTAAFDALTKTTISVGASDITITPWTGALVNYQWDSEGFSSGSLNTPVVIPKQAGTLQWYGQEGGTYTEPTRSLEVTVFSGTDISGNALGQQTDLSGNALGQATDINGNPI